MNGGVENQIGNENTHQSACGDGSEIEHGCDRDANGNDCGCENQVNRDASSHEKWLLGFFPWLFRESERKQSRDGS